METDLWSAKESRRAGVFTFDFCFALIGGVFPGELGRSDLLCDLRVVRGLDGFLMVGSSDTLNSSCFILMCLTRLRISESVYII